MARFKAQSLAAQTTTPSRSEPRPTLFADSRPQMFRQFYLQALNEVAAQAGKPVRGLGQRHQRWSWNPAPAGRQRVRTRARVLARKIARDRMARHREAVLYPMPPGASDPATVS